MRALNVQMICLQEIQHNDYISRLAAQLWDYPHYAFVPRRFAPVGGLMTFSQLPLVQPVFTPFENRGELYSPGFADYLLHKGVLATGLHASGQPLQVMNTHLQANYAGDWRRDNRFARIQADQVQQLARLVRQQPPEQMLLVCGDFNFPRDSFLYRELLEQSGLTDPLAGHPRPSYKPFPLAPDRWSTSIDYILLRPPPGLDVQVEADIVDIADSRARLRPLHFLTDHRALTVRLRW